MLNFYANSAQVLYDNPTVFTNGAVYCKLIGAQYTFNTSHSLSDIGPGITDGELLFAKSVTDVGPDRIFDASDMDIGEVPPNVGYAYLLFYTATQPLFILSDIEGLPGISRGGLVSISFSSAPHKIFSLDGSLNLSVGTHFVYAKDPVKKAAAPTDAPRRSGVAIGSAEAQAKPVSAKGGMYRDISSKAKAHPLTGDITAVSGRDAINQSLRTIILTNTGERPFSSRNVAGNISSWLFELGGVATRDAVKKTIMSAITSYERRITLLDVIVTEHPENNGLTVIIVYSIKTVGTKETFSIFLERV